MVHPFSLPQNPYFIEYLAFEGLFLPHEVKRIDNLWKAEQASKATLSGEHAYQDELRKSEVIHIQPSDDTQWIYQRLEELATKVNWERYFFDLTGFSEELQLAEYSNGGFFDWHLDFGPGGISTRKLSITVQLSNPDDYEGGELQFRINQNEVTAPKTLGTVIVFPSFIMHRVTPVTKGTRRSIVAWVHGTPYR